MGLKAQLHFPENTPSQSNGSQQPVIERGDLAGGAIQEMDRHGFIIVKNFLKPSQIRDLHNSVQPFLNKAEKDFGTSKNKDIVSAMYRTPEGRKVVSDIVTSPFVRNVLKKYQKTSFIDHIKMLVKAEKGPDTPWHQDAAFWTDYDPEKSMLSLWIAVTPVTIENGCMQLMKIAPHLDTILPHNEVRQGKELEIPDHVISELKARGGEAVNCELMPGDMLIFNSTNIHRAHENVSDDVRVALKMAFQDMSKRQMSVPMHPSALITYGLKGWINRAFPCYITARRFKN